MIFLIASEWKGIHGKLLYFAIKNEKDTTDFIACGLRTDRRVIPSFFPRLSS